MEERAIYTEVIKDNIEYDIFAADSNYGDLKEVVLNIMLDTITSRASFIKINGSDIPKEVVKSRLLKLNHENIEYVMDKLLSSTSEIVNIPRYILTALYNSQTESFYWHNQVKKDGII